MFVANYFVSVPIRIFEKCLYGTINLFDVLYHYSKRVDLENRFYSTPRIAFLETKIIQNENYYRENCAVKKIHNFSFKLFVC